MRKLLLVCLGVIALASSARAALVLDLPTISGTPGSSGTFEVWVHDNPGPTGATLSGWQVGLQLSSAGVVTITNITAPTAHTAVLGSSTLRSRYSSPALTQPGTYAANAGSQEWVNNVGATDVQVVNGSQDGLFKVSYTVAANATPGTVINFIAENPGGRTDFYDPDANSIPFTVSGGSFTVTAVPEPATLGLALLGLPLLARRRR